MMEAEEKLFDAARRGQADAVEEVIQEHPDLLQFQDRWGLTPLHSAAVAGCANVIAVLLDYRATVDGSSRSGQTALHFAAREGRDAAVQELIRRHADVARRTAHGILPLELAQPNCQTLIREEASRRIKVIEEDIDDLQERLARAVQAKELLEAQLFVPPPASTTSTVPTGSAEGVLAPQNAIQQATKSMAEAAQLVDRGPKETYWCRAAAWLSVQRYRGRAALLGTFMRQSPRDLEDPFPWTGPLVSENPLPSFDPEDEELPASFARLALVAQEKQRRKEGLIPAEATLEQEILGMALEMALDENTGRSTEEWEELVSALNAPGATWDWSKVEVKNVEATRRRGSPCVGPGVFAVAPAPDEVEVAEEEVEETDETEPVEPPAPPLVFQPGDIIGPIGGVLRRKKSYMAEHYGDELWFFYDPLAHELPLRIQSTELRTEPMVLDLGGLGTNRLRYLRDQRPDPLKMADLLPPAYDDDGSVSESQVTAEVALWPPRSAMTRINSRSLPPQPASPFGSSLQPPDSPGAMTSSILGSSFADVLPPAEANCQIVDVHVHGWPYSFVVATANIYAEEELFIDRGEEFWERQRSVLERLRMLAPGLDEILTGVTLPEPAAPDPAGAFPPRTPHTRPSSKPS